jgi:asparagine synthase (glutamine-hydrolysing)
MPIANPRCSGGNQPTTIRALAALLLAAAIPPKFKIRSLEEKYILKRAFADILPSSIANRPKKPYRAPIAACFLPGKNNLGAELMMPDALEKSGFANVAAFGKLMQKASGSASVGGALSERDEMAVATMASLQLLQQQYVTDFQPTRSDIAVLSP